jgi:purine-binding chemotaxis protein CheW
MSEESLLSRVMKNGVTNVSIMELASMSETVRDTANTVQFLVFQIGKGNFGINILDTHEILKPVTITRLPNVDSEFLGVINLRGNIIPVMDMNKKFARRFTDLTNFSRIVVANHNSKYMGLLVDRVVEVARIHEDNIEGSEARGFSNRYVTGVGRVDEKRLFLILNLDIVFESTNL